MEIKLSVLNTNTVTNETVIKDFFINDGEWVNNIEVPAVKGKEARTMNETFNAFTVLYELFVEVLNLSEELDFDDDIDTIYPIYTASDGKKRKRGYIYDLNEKDGIKTRIILFAPKHYLPSFL